MGVDFVACCAAGCRMTIPDSIVEECHPDFGGCGAVFCSEEHAGLKREDEPDQPIPTWDERETWSQEKMSALKISCVECRMQNPTDANLLDFILHRFAMTKEEATKLFLDPGTLPMPFENMNRWLRAHGKDPDENLWRISRTELDDLEGRIVATMRKFRRDHGRGFTKTATMQIESIKDADGWTALATELGIDPKEQERFFKWGEYASIEIVVDQSMKIVDGRIIPRHA